MSERKSFENDQVKEKVLEYSDTKYTHIVMKKSDPDVCADEIWTLEESLEASLKRQRCETEAYGDVPDFQFYIQEITRTPKEVQYGGKNSRIRRIVEITLTNVEL